MAIIIAVATISVACYVLAVIVGTLIAIKKTNVFKDGDDDVR